MDANTWNSYHIISNRARSICYATRQQQFRMKTEYTVNQLANQAENQMELMNNLQVRQPFVWSFDLWSPVLEIKRHSSYCFILPNRGRGSKSEMRVIVACSDWLIFRIALWAIRVNMLFFSAYQCGGTCSFPRLTALFTVNFSHLFYNVIQRWCEAISG